MSRAILIVLDSFGIGATADAQRFGDAGANTLLHIAEACAAGACDSQGRTGPLRLPNLNRLGLGRAGEASCGAAAPGLEQAPEIIGTYGFAEELSSGKDTPSGHWEIAGVPVLFDWGYFTDKQQSFPPELLDAIIKEARLPGVLGNVHASGTQIIKDLGMEHRATGKPIFYTSADSVVQIACHEETFGLQRLYELCQITRKHIDPYNIARVIARPFVGASPEGFRRTGARRDFATPPHKPTLLDKLNNHGKQVIAIGKISDIYAGKGVSRSVKADGLGALVEATLTVMNETDEAAAKQDTLIFTNLVDFDMLYGHRRDVTGYAKALEDFDAMLPDLLGAMMDDDLLILTADHGCDPTWPGSDHTREHIPILMYGKRAPHGFIGARKTFADIGQTLAEYFQLDRLDFGESFLVADK
ncbi:phosphopentomutase [Hahella chejuensis KCTC 2396]|uniref:Phosphopentomutase n=1 Tax=Hahella chejuensis (strain KCTC 2396) TaxID=349521 RepID=DEOB_HAHCH|nr:phosphopentomutase [Hahella chejuensis]Q2SHN3.1 RecName: Full=Phosphopentomutase; AltName: Full=Phosphodeoxyribomutase [Hahella chejuensis KCTC 2396]ABC29841.1 phosphopentomutase [Hahella chejuensis KCTC 2396]